MGSGCKRVDWEEREGLELCEAKGLRVLPLAPSPRFPFLSYCGGGRTFHHPWKKKSLLIGVYFGGRKKNQKVATTLQPRNVDFAVPGRGWLFSCSLLPFFGLLCTDLGLSFFAFVASGSRLLPRNRCTCPVLRLC